MTNYREILKGLAWRGVLAAGAFGGGWLILARAEGGWGAVPQLLFGMAFLVTGALVIATPLARLVAEPAGNLFYPNERFRRPLPMYGIPQSLRAKGRYEEAMAGFEKLAADYPDEVQPYVEMLELAIRDLEDPRRAARIYRQGLSALKSPAARETLERLYSGIRTRLHARPSN